MKRWQALAVAGIIIAVALVLVLKGILTEADNGMKGGLLPDAQLKAAMEAHQPALALFHSTTCIPCKEMEAIVNQVKPDFQKKVVFVDVNVYDDDNLPLVREARIRTIPTTMLFNAKGKVRTYYGVINAQQLREEVDQVLAE